MDANPIQFPQAHTTDSGSLYRITELLSKLMYGNRGMFHDITFNDAVFHTGVRTSRHCFIMV